MENADNIDNLYTIIRLIGNNGIYKTYLVRNGNNQQFIAKVERINFDRFEDVLNITTNVSALNHPNIIHLINHGLGTVTIGGNVQNNKNYLILDYYPKGNLFDYIFDGGGRFIERHAKFIFDKILRGVQAFHQIGICHRDLKLDNILLDQNFNPRISNFELATLFQGNNGINQLNDYLGTFGYCSPQIISHIPYNGVKNDIFSLGVILFNLVVGQKGFGSAQKNDQYYRLIMTGHLNDYWRHFVNNNYSQEFKNLYISMVSFNENQRPSIEQILQNNWFDEIRNLNNQQQIQLENEVRNDFIQREEQINILQNLDLNNLEEPNNNNI